MRSLARLVVTSFGALAFVAACGGAPPPAAPNVAGTKPVVAAPIAIDTSPVAEPPGLLVVGRVAKAENILKTVGSWTGLPIPGGAGLLRSYDEGLAEAVDLGQPIDGAVVLSGSFRDPKILAAIA